MRQELVVEVSGTPRPQGSIQVRAYSKEGKAILGSTTAGLKEWRAEMAAALRRGADYQNFAFPLKGPVRAELCFYLARPRTVQREEPCVRPDLDKLVRAALDAITESGIFSDDAQVCELHANKRYEGPYMQEGVHIGLREVGE